MTAGDRTERITRLLNEAALLRGKGQSDQAATLYEAALKYEPKNPTTNFVYAEFLLETNKPELAKKAFFKSVINARIGEPHIYSFFLNYSKYWDLDDLAPFIDFVTQTPKLAHSLVVKLMPAQQISTSQKILSEISKKFPKREEAILIDLEILRYQKDANRYLERSRLLWEKNTNKLEFFSHYLIALIENNENQLALDSIDKYIKLSESNYFLDFNRAVILKNLGRIADASLQYKNCLLKYGPSKDIFYNLGNCLESGGHFKEAIDSYNKALSIDENDPKIWINLATAYNHSGKLVEAKDCFNKVLKIKPTSAEAISGLALVDLTLGNFEQGWIGYEKRWSDPLFINAERKQSKPYHKFFTYVEEKKNLKNKSILIIAEQGVGDVIMFLSTLPELLTLSKTVAIILDGRLEKLFKNSFPGLSICTYDMFQPQRCIEFDFTIPSGSLGYLFRQSHNEFSREPFLRASSQAQKKISTIIESLKIKRPRVGLSWRGGTNVTRVQHRSIKLQELEPIVALEGVEFINIQHGDVSSEIAAFERATGKAIHSLPHSDMRDFDDLAAIVDQMDLIITVQNTNVHIAGAIGKECWTMVPASPEWRYGYSGKRMPWYSSVELFRQNEAMNWTGVIEQIRERLEFLVSTFKR